MKSGIFMRLIFLSVLLCFFVGQSFYADDSPQGPTEPEEPEAGFTDPFAEFTNQTSTDRLISEANVLARVYIQFADGTRINRLVNFSNQVLIHYTNESSNSVKVRMFTLFDLKRIDYLQWETREVSNQLYSFFPTIYRLYPANEETFEVKGNIPELNQFQNGPDNQNGSFYAYYYDRWIKGEKDHYRWQNSGSTLFSTHFDKPLDKVVVRIDFLTYY